MPRNPKANTAPLVLASMAAAKKADHVSTIRQALDILTGLTSETESQIETVKEGARSVKFTAYGSLFAVGALIPNDDKRGEAIDALLEAACAQSNSDLRGKLFKAGKITPPGSKFKKAITLGVAGVKWDDVVQEVDKLKVELPRVKDGWMTPEEDRALMVANRMGDGKFDHKKFVKEVKDQVKVAATAKAAKKAASVATGSNAAEVAPRTPSERLEAARQLLEQVRQEGYIGLDAVMADLDKVTPPVPAAPSPVADLGGVADPATFLTSLGTKDGAARFLAALLKTAQG